MFAENSVLVNKLTNKNEPKKPNIKLVAKFNGKDHLSTGKFIAEKFTKKFAINLWLSIVFIMQMVTPTFGSYNYCSGIDCTEIMNMARVVSKCNGLLICYESQFTNPALISTELKLPMLYNIRAVKGPRICQSCIESGNCKTYSNGKEIQWNGFMLFYNGDYKTTDVLLDIAGHRASFNITNVTPAEFLKGLSHDKSILDKLRAFFKSDDFWKSFITEGIRLEEVIGFEVLEKDLKFWLHDIASASRSHYAKNIKLENCLESQCSYYTDPTDYDDYSCYCGFPVSEKPKSAVKNKRVNSTNKCCDNYHQCIIALANCTDIHYENNYIKIDRSKYHHQENQLHMTIKCMAERNDYCQQTLCLCDSTLASCWSKIPAPQSSPGCFSCYLDDARNYVSGPINEVIDIRSRYLPRELELSLHIFDVREGKDVPKANDAIILAVMDVNSGIDSVRQSQIEMDKIIHETRNLIKEDAENYEKFLSSNDDLRAKASKCNVEFRSLMLRIAPHLYINEQLLTYDASKRVLNATKHLEALILNMKEEKMVNGKK